MSELLELAAKAAGITGRVVRLTAFIGQPFVFERTAGSYWKPNISDGDSRLLQVALDMDMALNDELTPDHVRCLAVCPVTLMVHANVVPYTEDMPIEQKLAACRLAVLRNAASIGREMP